MSHLLGRYGTDAYCTASSALIFFLSLKIIEGDAFQLCCCVACIHLSDQVRHSATGEGEQDRLVRLNQLNNPRALATYIYPLIHF